MTVLLVSVLQVLCGMGVLANVRYAGPRSAVLPLSLLFGMFLHTVAFFFVDVIHMGFSQSSLVITAAICFVLSHSNYKRISVFYSAFMSKPRIIFQMHDVVTIVIGSAIAYYVVWAAWYWPVTPFDAMAGIDLVAREAVTQGTIANKVFTHPSLSGNLSNQYFYAPFAMLLQVMYRLMGFMYGQVWVPIVAIAFSWIVFVFLRQNCHPFIANVLWLLFILTPEMLGYTYLLQTDYVNAAFFCLGVLFFVQAMEKNGGWSFSLSALAFAGACWARSETILIVALGLLFSMPIMISRFGMRTALIRGLVIGVSSLIPFLLWNAFYVQYRLPVHPDYSKEIVSFNVSRFLNVTSDTFSALILNADLWGWTFLLLAVGVIVNAIVTRKAGNLTLPVWIAATFVGLLLVGTMFSAAVVEQTLRRGIFKLVPLVFVYVALMPLATLLSAKLSNWETRAQA